MIDTSGTFHAAYVIVAIILIGYTVSLARRARKYRERAERADGGRASRDSAI
jgi:hypothetical protein